MYTKHHKHTQHKSNVLKHAEIHYMNPYTYRERGRQTLCPSTQLTTHSCRITSTHNFLQFFYEIDKLCTTVNTINASYYLILQFNQNFHSGRPKSKILNQKIRTGPLNMPSKHGLLQKKNFFNQSTTQYCISDSRGVSSLMMGCMLNMTDWMRGGAFRLGEEGTSWGGGSFRSLPRRGRIQFSTLQYITCILAKYITRTTTV